MVVSSRSTMRLCLRLSMIANQWRTGRLFISSFIRELSIMMIFIANWRIHYLLVEAVIRCLTSCAQWAMWHFDLIIWSINAFVYKQIVWEAANRPGWKVNNGRHSHDTLLSPHSFRCVGLCRCRRNGIARRLSHHYSLKFMTFIKSIRLSKPSMHRR